MNDRSKVYTYDQANRLTSISANGLTWSAAYNGDGARLKQSSNGSVTTYTLDLAAPLVQVLVQQDVSGTTRYLYGVTRLGEQQPGGWAYHLSDALGSVRQLVDGSAQVTLARGYMPYGEALWSVGSSSSVYGYTGEDWNTVTQLVFLRARYMRPGLGVFVSRDPWEGDAERPLAYNGWMYVEGNPTNFVDPLGLFICAVRKAAYMTYKSSNGGYDGTLSLHIAESFSPGFCGLCVITQGIVTREDHSWSARSGVLNTLEPVPPSDYLVDPMQIRYNLSVPHYNWGLARLCLKSPTGQHTNYCIHGGHSGGTAGCIKVNNEDLLNVMFTIASVAKPFKLYINSDYSEPDPPTEWWEVVGPVA